MSGVVVNSCFWVRFFFSIQSVFNGKTHFCTANSRLKYSYRIVLSFSILIFVTSNLAVSCYITALVIIFSVCTWEISKIMCGTGVRWQCMKTLLILSGEWSTQMFCGESILRWGAGGPKLLWWGLASYPGAECFLSRFCGAVLPLLAVVLKPF